MGADLIVLPTSVPYECLGFQQGGEDFSVDEFIPQLAVEGLTQSVRGEGMMKHLFLRLSQSGGVPDMHWYISGSGVILRFRNKFGMTWCRVDSVSSTEWKTVSQHRDTTLALGCSTVQLWTPILRQAL